MTIEEFMKKFRTCLETDQWNLHFSAYEDIHGQLRLRDRGIRYCPITYVAKRKLNEVYTSATYAGGKIGLTWETIWSLMETADGNDESAYYLEKLRQDMFKACRLHAT